MKKILSLISAMFIALSTLTSCDEDVMISYNLEGSWSGNLYQVSTFNGKTYSASSSEIRFNGDPYRSTSGSGYWVDHYSNAPWDYWANHIRWSVDNRIITIYFVEDKTTIEIHDFRLSNNRFEGWFYDDEHTTCEFSLVHTSSPSDYNSYDWGYHDNIYYYDDYGYDDYYGYNSWSKATRSSNDSINNNKEKPVRKTLKNLGNNK